MRVLDSGDKKRGFHAVAFDPTGRRLVAGGDYHQTVMWDVATGTELWRASGGGYHCRFFFQPHTGHLVTPGNGGLEIIDADNGGLVGTRGTTSAGAAVIDPTDGWCVYFTYGPRPELTAVRRLGEPDEEVVWQAPIGDAPDESGFTRHLACLGDGERFVSSEYVSGRGSFNTRNRLAIRSRIDGRLLRASGIDVRYGDAAFASPRSDCLVVPSNAAMRVYSLAHFDAAPPRVVRNDNRKHFTGVAFHPSGRFLATTGNDATVKLYDTTTWAVARTFTWDIGRMRSIAFSPDGTLAAAGSDSGKVVVWDVDV